MHEALIDAICSTGWDRPSRATPETARAAQVPPDDFLLACITGDAATVRALITPALATSPIGPRDWPPLLYVAFSRAPRHADLADVARVLLAHGADPSSQYVVRDPDGEASRFTALYAAIAVSDNPALVTTLLDAGADPNDGQSLYHAAERFETAILDQLHARGLDSADISYCLLHKLDILHADGIRWFLDHGADPNVRHPAAGETALHWAIKRAAPRSIIELLLARGADPSAATTHGHTAFPEIRATTPIDLALRLGRVDLAEAISAAGGMQSPTTATDELVLGCIAGRVTITPAQRDALPAADRALLTHLCQQDQTEAALRLLALGWPLDVPGWMGVLPLHWAACRGNAHLTRALLAAGAPQTDLGGYFTTPIHTAHRHRWALATSSPDYPAVIAALEAA